MDFERLKNNISDLIVEEQIKLGYRSESIRLYYPLQSLNRLLGVSLDMEEMRGALANFCTFVQDDFGDVGIKFLKDGRIGFVLPPKATDFIHSTHGDNPFLKDFIGVVAEHDITIDDVLFVFHRYSDHVHFEPVSHGEFDYLIFFEDGIPDTFRYCLTEEGRHMIYHRFTPEDYEDYHFDD